LKKLALEVSTDPDHQFDLAIQLGNLDRARALASASPTGPLSEPKWRAVGDKALECWRVDLAEECFSKANDLSALLLIYTSTGDAEGLARLATLASAKGANNVAFASTLTLGRRAQCVEVLLESGREAEASLFARTYAPSMVPKALEVWKASRSDAVAGRVGKRAPGAVAVKKSNAGDVEEKKREGGGHGLADPREMPEAFLEGWDEALKKEKTEEEQRAAGRPASSPRVTNGIDKQG
jgi:coatomer subunit beta'